MDNEWTMLLLLAKMWIHRHLNYIFLTCGKLSLSFTKMGSKIGSAKHLQWCHSGICWSYMWGWVTQSTQVILWTNSLFFKNSCLPSITDGWSWQLTWFITRKVVNEMIIWFSRCHFKHGVNIMDVTLAYEDEQLWTHKVILRMCSPSCNLVYFANMDIMITDS